MQLSLVDDLPELKKKVFLDIFAKTYFDTRRNRMRLKTIEGQNIPADLQIGCMSVALQHFPEGTVYKLDARLVIKTRKKPYFVAIRRKILERALEFYDHNIKIQKGLSTERKEKKVLKERKGTPKKDTNFIHIF